jgi:hypothetical protein
MIKQLIILAERKKRIKGIYSFNIKYIDRNSINSLGAILTMYDDIHTSDGEYEYLGQKGFFDKKNG